MELLADRARSLSSPGVRIFALEHDRPVRHAVDRAPHHAHNRPATQHPQDVRCADDHGYARYARIVESPSINLNPSAVDAASKSEYSAAVFRCKPVSSGYQFVVDYGP